LSRFKHSQSLARIRKIGIEREKEEWDRQIEREKEKKENKKEKDIKIEREKEKKENKEEKDRKIERKKEKKGRTFVIFNFKNWN
jgi:hypothetical protein